MDVNKEKFLQDVHGDCEILIRYNGCMSGVVYEVIDGIVQYSARLLWDVEIPYADDNLLSLIGEDVTDIMNYIYDTRQYVESIRVNGYGY